MRSWSDPVVRRAVLAVVEGVHGRRNGAQPHADTDRLNHDQAADLVMAEIRRLRMEDVTVLPTGLAPEEQAAVWATVRHSAVAELAALGRLQPLLDDDSVQDVNVNGCDEVWVIRSDGSKTRADPVADTDEELLRLGQRIARRYGREGEQEWSETRPVADITLAHDGARLASTLRDPAQRPGAVQALVGARLTDSACASWEVTTTSTDAAVTVVIDCRLHTTQMAGLGVGGRTVTVTGRSTIDPFFIQGAGP